MKEVMFFGECMVEMSGQPFDHLRTTFGGDTLNSALYFSRLTRGEYTTHYFTALGDDPFSHAMRAAWREEGIALDCVLIDAERQPGLYAIQVDAHGERRFFYWRAQAAARFVLRHAQVAPCWQTARQCEAFYLSGISLAVCEDRERLVTELRALKAAGVSIVFDSNYRPRLWSSPQVAQQAMCEILALCDVALVTFDDEQMLWGDVTPQQTLTRMRQHGIAQAVVKNGAQGAWYDDQGAAQCMPAITVPKVVDTTAAGDAFNAACLAQILRGNSLASACLAGHRLAAAVIQYPGAIIPLSQWRYDI